MPTPEIQNVGAVTAKNLETERQGLLNEVHAGGKENTPGTAEVTEVTNPNSGNSVQAVVVTCDGGISVEQAIIGGVSSYTTYTNNAGDPNLKNQLDSIKDPKISELYKQSLEANGQITYQDPKGNPIPSPSLGTVLPNKSTIALSDKPISLKEACSLLLSKYEKTFAAVLDTTSSPTNRTTKMPRTPGIGLGPVGEDPKPMRMVEQITKKEPEE